MSGFAGIAMQFLVVFSGIASMFQVVTYRSKLKKKEKVLEHFMPKKKKKLITGFAFS